MKWEIDSQQMGILFLVYHPEKKAFVEAPSSIHGRLSPLALLSHLVGPQCLGMILP